MKSIKDGTNRVCRSANLQEPISMKNTWAKVWRNSGLVRKPLKRTLWETKSNFFNTYEEFLEATVQLEDDGTHQEIIADIEGKMRRGLDSRKAVKRVLPKHKHHFESLFEYKSDDEDD